jgi:hypothetical protein
MAAVGTLRNRGGRATSRAWRPALGPPSWWGLDPDPEPARDHPPRRLPHGRSARRRLVWWFTFLSFALLAGVWAVATPIDGGPDEQDHVLRAAAVAHGELVGKNGAYVRGTGALVTAPVSLSVLMAPTPCFAFHPERTADCARLAAVPPTGTRPQPSGAGRYFPLYYGIVGLPTLAFQWIQGFYLMRLLSLLVNAAFVASAVASAALWRRSPLMVTGLYAAVTPTVLFLCGAVNPNSWEITAALCVWTSSIALLFTEDTTDDSRLLARIGVAALVFVSMRSLSPLWLALALLLVGVATLKGRVLEVFRWRATIIWVAAVVVVTVLAVTWTVQLRVLDIGHIGVPRQLGLPDRIETSLLRVPARAQEMVGLFGWLDTPSPALTHLLWSAGVGALVFLGLAGVARLPRAALMGAILLTIAVPIAAEVPGANTYGFAWQGRYTLPLAVGVPILAGVAAGAGATLGPRAGVRLSTWLAALLGVAQFAAFWWMLLRYQVGVGRGLNPLEGAWHPPGGSLLILVLYAVGLLSWGVAASTAWRLMDIPAADAPPHQPSRDG